MKNWYLKYSQIYVKINFANLRTLPNFVLVFKILSFSSPHINLKFSTHFLCIIIDGRSHNQFTKLKNLLFPHINLMIFFPVFSSKRRANTLQAANHLDCKSYSINFKSDNNWGIFFCSSLIVAMNADECLKSDYLFCSIFS